MTLPPLPDLTGLTVYPEWEGQTLEFKQSLEKICKDKVYPTICAFLNTKGGRIIFGIEDVERKIVGLPADSKKIDSMLLYVDAIYHNKIIVDDENKPPAVGQVTTSLVDLADGHKLLVVDVLPQEKHYKTSDGTTWFRLSASNYRMATERSSAHMEALAKENVELSMRLEQARAQLSTMNRSLADTNQKLKDCKAQRDASYTQAKALQEQFRTFVGATKEMEAKLTGAAKTAEAGATALVKALEVDIVSRKEAAEERMAEERSQRFWWCWPC